MRWRELGNLADDAMTNSANSRMPCVTILRQLAARDIGGFCLPERFTGGAAVGDVNNDGWTDVVVASMIDPQASSSATKARNLATCKRRGYFHRYRLRELGVALFDANVISAWICFLPRLVVRVPLYFCNNRIRMRVARI